MLIRSFKIHLRLTASTNFDFIFASQTTSRIKNCGLARVRSSISEVGGAQQTLITERDKTNEKI